MPKMPKVGSSNNMDNREFAKKLEERTRKFAVRIIRLSAQLPNTQEARVVRTQITKCGTSIGANYREANRARSKADLGTKSQFVKVKPAKPNIGWRLSKKQIGFPGSA